MTLIELFPHEYKKLLDDEDKKNIERIDKLIKVCHEKNIQVFPKKENIFRALDTTKLKDIKVVIIGQDCYFNEVNGQPEANGLAFSVNKGIKIPSSLNNIFKNMLNNNQFYKYPEHGDLTFWAHQGVLLFNTALTVQEGIKLSHSKYWQTITDKIIKYISDNNDYCIFVLWGGFALGKKKLIDESKHDVLVSSHPSGLSCNTPLNNYSAFMESNHFGQINKLLKKNNKKEIIWQIV